MKKYILPLFILLTGLLYIFIIPSDPFAISLLFKVIPMWLIIYFGYLQFPSKRSGTHWIMLVGLIFCMFGDALLHWFVIGLSAFLIGHLFYLTAFFKNWRFSMIRFAMIIPILLFSFLIGKQLVTSLLLDGNNGLVIPVIGYVLIISLMAWSAIMSGNKWAMIGSILFVLSDSILSWNMFVSDIPNASILIMGTYYTAQFLMAKSIGTLSKSTPAVD
ncbi:putative membrane protein YhhN [Cytobacillus eiseniae]|uniref:Membrane protein YhhN n=1 Tax=Cytobacillus eiseniae TaxID=762947 RepID=A0ABS4RGQ5_9BACI|nr:lysoplasmalogenase [Cytobacillus eiseniae]MBP2242067.1 putative membrane protein YhhN [Cytobacillus eiseniae]